MFVEQKTPILVKKVELQSNQMADQTVERNFEEEINFTLQLFKEEEANPLRYMRFLIDSAMGLLRILKTFHDENKVLGHVWVNNFFFVDINKARNVVVEDCSDSFAQGTQIEKHEDAQRRKYFNAAPERFGKSSERFAVHSSQDIFYFGILFLYLWGRVLHPLRDSNSDINNILLLMEQYQLFLNTEKANKEFSTEVLSKSDQFKSSSDPVVKHLIYHLKRVSLMCAYSPDARPTVEKAFAWFEAAKALIVMEEKVMASTSVSSSATQCMEITLDPSEILIDNFGKKRKNKSMESTEKKKDSEENQQQILSPERRKKAKKVAITPGQGNIQINDEKIPLKTLGNGSNGVVKTCSNLVAKIPLRNSNRAVRNLVQEAVFTHYVIGDIYGASEFSCSAGKSAKEHATIECKGTHGLLMPVMPEAQNAYDFIIKVLLQAVASGTKIIYQLDCVGKYARNVAMNINNYVHGKGIVHRDIKWNNFLKTFVFENGKKRPLLFPIDFGEAAFQGSDIALILRDQNNRLVHIAPELFADKPGKACASYEQDVFSLGVAFLRLLTWAMECTYSKNYYYVSLHNILKFYTERFSVEENNAKEFEKKLQELETKLTFKGPEVEWVNRYLKIAVAMCSFKPEDRPTLQKVVEDLDLLLEPTQNSGKSEHKESENQQPIIPPPPAIQRMSNGLAQKARDLLFNTETESELVERQGKRPVRSFSI